MKTNLLYLDDTYLTEQCTTLVDSGIDERGQFLVLDSTVFYPQGGGQPSDVGTLHIGELASHKVNHVSFVESTVRHYVDPIELVVQGTPVQMKVDIDQRLVHARTHTAGHFLAHLIEELVKDAIPQKGHHFPGGAYVQFVGAGRSEIPEIVSELNSRGRSEIEAGREIHARLSTYDEIAFLRPNFAPLIPKDKPSRIVTIGDYKPFPCGGTHVANLSDLRDLKIVKIAAKKDATTVRYEV